MEDGTVTFKTNAPTEAWKSDVRFYDFAYGYIGGVSVSFGYHISYVVSII